MPHEDRTCYNPYGAHWAGYLAVVLWTVLGVGVIALAVLRPRGHTVYPIFANAGECWRDGTSVYGDKRASHDLDFFRYSPTVAALFAPMSLLSLGAGGALWRVVNLVAILGGLAWWFRAVLPDGLDRLHFGWLLLMTLPLSAVSLHNGQSNPLVLGLLLATAAAAARGRWTLAASAVVAASEFKVYPLSVGLLIAVAFPRPFAWRLAVAIAVAAALPFLAQRPSYVASQYAEWVTYLSTDVRHHVSFERSYRDLRFLVRAWGGTLDNTTYQALQIAGAAAAAGACLASSLARRSVGRQLTLALGLGAVWMTLLGPATESPSYMLIGPTLAWGVVEASMQRRRGAHWVLGIAFLLALADQVSLLVPGGQVVRHTGALPLAALLTLVGVVWLDLADGSLASVDSDQPTGVREDTSPVVRPGSLRIARPFAQARTSA